MRCETDDPQHTSIADGLRRLAARTGVAEDYLRRAFIVERLLMRLLDDAPDRWVRFDDWRLEYRHDGPAGTPDDGEEVTGDAQAAVDAALRRAAAYRGLEPVQLSVRVLTRWPEVAEGPALAYTVEAADHDGDLGEVDLLVGFAYPRADEIEWRPGLDVPDALDGPPPRLPTRSCLARLTARLGEYTARTSRFPDPKDLLAIARYAPHLTCTAEQLRRALDRVWPWTASPTWPLAVPGPPPWWADAYRRGALELGLDPAMAVGHAWAAALLDPILSATVAPGATWDPAAVRWVNPRPPQAQAPHRISARQSAAG